MDLSPYLASRATVSPSRLTSASSGRRRPLHAQYDVGFVVLARLVNPQALAVATLESKAMEGDVVLGAEASEAQSWGL